MLTTLFQVAVLFFGFWAVSRLAAIGMKHFAAKQIEAMAQARAQEVTAIEQKIAHLSSVDQWSANDYDQHALLLAQRDQLMTLN